MITLLHNFHPTELLILLTNSIILISKLHQIKNRQKINNLPKQQKLVLKLINMYKQQI